LKCVGSDVPSPEPVECAKLELQRGPTAIHWNCITGTQTPTQINPYNNKSPEGTQCSPTASCADPPLPKSIKCVSKEDEQGVGVWKDDADNEVEEAKDVICNCPILKVKESEATCTDSSDLTADEAGMYELTEPRTCIILCDGIFVSTLTCEFNANKETTWVSTYADGPPEELEAGCTLSCDSNVCTPPPTALPLTTTTVQP